MFSKTHLYNKDVCQIHNCMGVKLILKLGMCLIWSGSLVHCGAKSRTNDDGNHLLDLRLFAYLWYESQHGLRSESQREDSTDLHRGKMNICASYDRHHSECNKCSDSTKTVIDLKNIRLGKYEVGDVILGDLASLGWIVIKGERISKKIQKDIQCISESKGGWFNIEHGTDRLQKFNSTYDTDLLMLSAKPCTLRFFTSVKSNILDKHLPSSTYIIGKTNLLKNLKPIHDNQWPHTDFKEKKE